jgi:hypothetical protein
MDRASAFASEGRSLEALHLLDIVLASESLTEGLRTKRAALEDLLEKSGRENFSEVQYLEQEINQVNAALAE